MKSILHPVPAASSPHRRLLRVWLVAGLLIGWGYAQLQAGDAPESVAPLPEVKLQKIPVLRLPELESQFLTKPSHKVASKNAKKAAAQRRRQKAVVTGSKIPQTVGEGRGLVTSCPVVVIDRREMSRTGAQTASQLFGRMPFGR